MVWLNQFLVGPQLHSLGVLFCDNGGMLKAINIDSYHPFVELFFDAQNNLFEIEDAILKKLLSVLKGVYLEQ